MTRTWPYPVDARGLMVDPRFDAEKPGPTNAIAMAKTPGGMVGVKNQETMIELAAGRAGTLTYLLGFHPVDESFDGKFHKIEVQVVGRKGVHLRSRKGFFDLPERPQDEKARKTELANAAWSPLDASGIGIAAKIVPSKTKSDRWKLFWRLTVRRLAWSSSQSIGWDGWMFCSSRRQRGESV